MDAVPPSLDPLHSPTHKPLLPAAADSTQTTSITPPSKPTGKPTSTSTKTTTKKLKNKKKLSVDGSEAPSSSASSYCSSSTSHPVQRGVRLRNPRVFIGSARQKEGDVEALALPLGMSIAAVVLERKNTTGGAIAVDHLSEICTLAVRESLANVFGHKFDSFVKNFEKSFRSTLMTLRLINESSQSDREHQRHLNSESNYFSDMTAQVSRNDEHCLTCTSGVRSCQPEAVGPTISSEEHFGILGETEQNTISGLLNRELALNDGEINQQLACVSSSSVNQSMFSTFERSVIEQTRSNDLKTFEIGLTMKKLQMKEKQLTLHSDLNFLERCKLSMGTKRASFKAEKFKTELEETRHAELLKKCTDCLVAGLLIMLASIGYGTYVYSHRRITEATASCMPSKVLRLVLVIVPFQESNSWWVPKHVSSFNSGLQLLSCYLQVLSRVIFGLFMILAIAYLLLLRSSVSSQTMPVTFILMLGVACGFAGKLCIDTLGGSGYHWLLHWEVLCILHFFSSVRTSDLFHVLYGPISVSHGGAMEKKTMFPYWIRRFFFYAVVLLLLPMICGLVPFASPAEWKDHLSLKVMDLLQPTSEWD
ncbi:hypothetical protein RHMOL_Rhmol10G0228600 [Rhododendron molle]|uniref:Uncharacterized protein n=1 Tax=Rhododendron molle TaxID=49168 RepID=A0ACC0M5A9_RHOML|nr:hypothetical protein RHMOL_Rhmol10G0228600 [Rhododendron molle]